MCTRAVFFIINILIIKKLLSFIKFKIRNYIINYVGGSNSEGKTANSRR